MGGWRAPVAGCWPRTLSSQLLGGAGALGAGALGAGALGAGALGAGVLGAGALGAWAATRPAAQQAGRAGVLRGAAMAGPVVVTAACCRAPRCRCASTRAGNLIREQLHCWDSRHEAPSPQTAAGVPVQRRSKQRSGRPCMHLTRK